MNQFDIGTFVVINKCTVKLEPSGNKVKWVDISYSKPRLGRIVGLCRRWDGIRHLGDYFSPDDYGPAYLEGTKENILYEIKLGWFNKPIYARPKNIRLAILNEIKDLPKLFTQQSSWSESTKKFLREEVKHWPRDKKGRWIKNEPKTN